ncbi:hypothetical protein [Xanthomonas phage X2]|nr:hypothetical protein [Xanthomonas phage X2]
MKLRYCILAAAAALGFANVVKATDDFEANIVRSDISWHGIGGGVQINHRTFIVQGPLIQAWQRTPVNPSYQDFLYVKGVFDCQQWSFRAVTIMFSNGQYQDLSDPAIFPEPGTQPYNTLNTLCGAYGYHRAPGQMRQALPPPPAPVKRAVIDGKEVKLVSSPRRGVLRIDYMDGSYELRGPAK